MLSVLATLLKSSLNAGMVVKEKEGKIVVTRKKGKKNA